MTTSSRRTDTVTKACSLHRAAGALFAFGLLVLSAGLISTTITGEWSYVVFYAIGATVLSLAGWIALGFSERLITSMWKESDGRDL